MTNERPFRVTRSNRKKQEVSTRAYARLDTAASRTVQLAILDGEPGDTFQLHHAGTGKVLGEVKVKVAARPIINWIWEK